MKRTLLFPFILLMALTVKAQQQLSYAYDAAGNRVSRTIVLGTRGAAAANPTDSVYFEELLADKQIKIYPNPVEFQLTIAIEGYETSMQGEFSLYSIAGNMLVRQHITSGLTYVDMSRYTRGTYILNIQLNGQPTSWKIIKQ